MSKRSPQEPPTLAELAELLPRPADRELPDGRHERHRQRLLAAIDPPARTPAVRAAAPRRGLLRPALALSALVVAAAGVAAAVTLGRPDDPGVAVPSPAVSSPAATAGPGDGVPAKVRGYGTVAQLTAAADLIVRGEVGQVTGAGADRRAVLQVAETLHGAVPATLVLAVPDGSPQFAPGRPVVLYLALIDPAGPVYGPLSGDFGVFDLAGDIATARSADRSVTGLRDEDAAGYGHRFSTPLGELRRLAEER